MSREVDGINLYPQEPWDGATLAQYVRYRNGFTVGVVLGSGVVIDGLVQIVGQIVEGFGHVFLRLFNVVAITPARRSGIDFVLGHRSGRVNQGVNEAGDVRSLVACLDEILDGVTDVLEALFTLPSASSFGKCLCFSRRGR